MVLAISLDCTGKEVMDHGTGGPKSVPVPSRDLSNGTSTSQNVFFGAVPVARRDLSNAISTSSWKK